MSIQSKIQKFFHEIRARGFAAGVRRATWRIAWIISPNFRINPAAVPTNVFSRFIFICVDGCKNVIDKSILFFDRTVGAYADASRSLFVKVGQYYVYPQALTPSSVVYSFGVGRNIDFDREFVQHFKARVYLFDPTPTARDFLDPQTLGEHFTFIPSGLWIEDTTLRFYTDPSGGQNNFSITNFYHTTSFVEAPVKRLSTFMKELGHEQLDVCKLDIEGAGLVVLEDLFDNASERELPKQIIAELEIPRFIYKASLRELIAFFRARRRLFKKIRNKGYALLSYGKGEFSAVSRLRLATYDSKK